MGEIWQNATHSVNMENGSDVAKRGEAEESATDVLNAECCRRRIEENHSMSSSQCDLD
jgi:hypothetical protein